MLISICNIATAELTQSFGWNLADVFMQHDVQEFNRLLQDKIDRSIKEAIPAQEVIKNLFKGSMKSYIRCINVNTESSKSETFSGKYTLIKKEAFFNE